MKKLNSAKNDLLSRRKARPQLSEQGVRPYFVSAVGTLEIVIVIAVLLSIALLFRTQITSFARNLFSSVFDQGYIDSL